MKLCGFNVGLDHRFFLIAGPCVIESEQLQMDTAGTLKEITSALGIPFIFKSSYDKANRSSGSTFRGPGMEKGLEILAKVKRELHLPILTDVHTEADVAERLDGQRRRAALYSAVDQLPERERHIVSARHLSDEPTTLSDLGAVMGISKERVRQLEERALQRLTKIVRDASAIEPV